MWIIAYGETSDRRKVPVYNGDRVDHAEQACEEAARRGEIRIGMVYKELTDQQLVRVRRVDYNYLQTAPVPPVSALRLKPKAAAGKPE